MAFTTIPGGDLADIILLGSEAADTVVLNTSQSIIANGFGGDDSITIANPVAATGGNFSDFTAPSTIYGGEGNDSLLIGQYIIGSSAILGGAGNDIFASRLDGGIDYQAAEANGNEGEDTFGAVGDGIRAVGSQILGGANNDTIYADASTNTEFNGNKNLDRIFVVGNQIGGSVFGGKGIDFIDTAFVDGPITYTNTSISGADGNDNITDTGVTVVANNSTLTVLGGQGVDIINLTLNSEDVASGERALIGGGTEDDFITIDGTITDARLTVQGGDGDDTISAFGNINGGKGADSMTSTAAGTNFLYSMTTIAEETGLTATTVDSITGFEGGAGGTFFKTGVAGTATNFLGNDGTADVASFAAALAEANTKFTQIGGDVLQYVVVDVTVAAGAAADIGQYVFFKNSTTFASATAAVLVNDTVITSDNFIA